MGAACAAPKQSSLDSALEVLEKAVYHNGDLISSLRNRLDSVIEPWPVDAQEKAEQDKPYRLDAKIYEQARKLQEQSSYLSQLMQNLVL